MYPNQYLFSPSVTVKKNVAKSQLQKRRQNIRATVINYPLARSGDHSRLKIFGVERYGNQSGLAATDASNEFFSASIEIH